MRPYRFRPPATGLLPSASVGNRPALVWLTRSISLLIAGSGALNLHSLLGGAIPSQQPAWLQFLFPLDIAGFSPTLTLIWGFALILVALHLWARKHRAWRIAFALALASTLFHLTPIHFLHGWSILEATSSAAICALLWLTRGLFVVGSERPRLATAARRALFAFAVATLYGTAGFWLLEPHEFHQNFVWSHALASSVRLLFFIGDPAIVPHTAYARWFLDSLFWISGAAFLYAGVVLFRPVVYELRTDRSSAARAAAIAAQWGRSGQDFFKHWPDKSLFFASNFESFIGYRVAGSCAIALGDPVGPPNQVPDTIAEFLAFCRARGWRVAFHQISADHLDTYQAFGFQVLNVGADALVDLSKFSLRGSARKEFRNTVTRLDRLGYRVQRVDPPLPGDLLPQLKQISDRWLQLPGHRERRFTLGRFDESYLRQTPVYVVFDPARTPVAFLNLIPSYDPTLATVDLMRRDHHHPVNGLMDYLFARVFLDLKDRGLRWFSLGMAPLTAPPSSEKPSLDQSVAHWTLKRLPFLFRADSLRRFKAKYADLWQPRYLAYPSRFDLPRLALALRDVSELPAAQALSRSQAEVA